MNIRTIAIPYLAIIVLFFIALTGGCNPNSQGPPANPTPPPNNPSEGGDKGIPPKSEPPAVVPVTAEDLLKEYTADRDATNKKYHGKIVEVSGPVDMADADNMHELPLVNLKAGAGVLSWVQCYFEPKDEQAVYRLGKGQSVKIQGAIREDWFGLGVPVFGCKIIDQGPDLAVVISAVDLTKELAADEAAARKKYQDKILVVDGTVLDSKVNDGKTFYTITLEGYDEKAEKPYRVQAECGCVSSKRLSAYYATIQKGQTLKVKGPAYVGTYPRTVKLSPAVILK